MPCCLRACIFIYSKLKEKKKFYFRLFSADRLIWKCWRKPRNGCVGMIVIFFLFSRVLNEIIFGELEWGHRSRRPSNGRRAFFPSRTSSNWTVLFRFLFGWQRVLLFAMESSWIAQRVFNERNNWCSIPTENGIIIISSISHTQTRRQVHSNENVIAT